MKEEQCIKGFKVFNPDWICNPRPGIFKQYTCPGRFKEDGEIKVCGHGMHFCKKAIDCFNYCSFNPKWKVAEVIARGEIKEFKDKCCTNDLEIVREISWQELLEIVNTGKGCTGYGNSGNRNSGNWNRGHRNSGNNNSGNYNSGNDNSGNGNSGNNNSGNYNSGNWNSCDFSNGCFNTETPKIYLFNKPSEWTYYDWRNSEARYILDIKYRRFLDFCRFNDLPENDDIKNKEAWWSELSAREKDVIKNLPNFDAAIFKETTGIDVNADERKL